MADLLNAGLTALSWRSSAALNCVNPLQSTFVAQAGRHLAARHASWSNSAPEVAESVEERRKLGAAVDKPRKNVRFAHQPDLQLNGECFSMCC